MVGRLSSNFPEKLLVTKERLYRVANKVKQAIPKAVMSHEDRLGENYSTPAWDNCGKSRTQNLLNESGGNREISKDLEYAP